MKVILMVERDRGGDSLGESPEEVSARGLGVGRKVLQKVTGFVIEILFELVTRPGDTVPPIGADRSFQDLLDQQSVGRE